MNRKYLLKRIAQDCIPTVFSLLMSGLYGVMDGLFVGRAVGDAGLAAINIAWPIAACRRIRPRRARRNGQTAPPPEPEPGRQSR